MKTVQQFNLNIVLEKIALMIRACNAAPNSLAYLHLYNNYNDDVLILTAVQLPSETLKNNNVKTIDFAQPYAFPFSKLEKVNYPISTALGTNCVYDVIE